MQFATCQHRLQEVACIHCAIRFPGTHNGMQLIDEQNDTALALLHLVQNRFQTLFEFATVLCAGDQSAQIQREDLPVFQVGRDIATHNSQCQTLCNGSFTDTRLTDQNRIVLGLSGEDSNDISYLIISADDRIQFSGTGTLHQILSVFRQDIIGFFRILCGNTLVATHFHQCLQKCILGYGKRLKHLANRRIHGIEQAQHQMLYRDVLILHPRSFLFCLPQCTIHILCNIHLICFPTAASNSGQCINGRFQLNLDIFHSDAHFLKQLRNQTAVLFQKRT